MMMARDMSMTHRDLGDWQRTAPTYVPRLGPRFSRIEKRSSSCKIGGARVEDVEQVTSRRVESRRGLVGTSSQLITRTICGHGKDRIECDLSNSLEKLADPIRFERTTSAFGGQRSIQLSYGSAPGW
jgi:hypothetical protein